MKTHVAGARFGFHEPPGLPTLPDEWRQLDRAVWRWVLAHGGDPVTAHAAAWASHAEGQGHSALHLSALEQGGDAGGLAPWHSALRQSALVSDGDDNDRAPRPFVLEGDHLYLLRNHRAEVAVARALARRRLAAQEPLRPLIDDELRAVFNGSWAPEEERQRAAVRQAPGRALMVLTGGPGTGKTTTVLRMLLGLSREHEARHGSLPRIRIAAPTGKAAQRLSGSLCEGAERLCGGDAPVADVWQMHLDAVLGAESGTVHRLLGSRGRHGGFAFNAAEPLPADIVVVDEASMLDLGLLRALLDALREDAVLVLVGDADQLTSVGTGSIMMDIVRALESDPSGDLVRLTHCFRADVTLIPINEAVRQGDVAAFDAAIAAAATQTTRSGRAAALQRNVADTAALRRRLVAWSHIIQQALAEVDITTPLATDDAALLQRLMALGRQQLLCALREGSFGALQANAVIMSRLRQWDALAPWAGRDWYPGRSVIITRNDAAARLYNGDVGICVPLRGSQGEVLLRVAFERPPEAALQAAGHPDAASPVRLFDPYTLPPHEDAFALTVHKSQGSEYDHVAVLLPPDPDSPLLVRQTLYTALSRARHSLELWSTPASTAKALSNPLIRYGRLAERIVEGWGGA